jgi:hypothetical protein
MAVWILIGGVWVGFGIAAVFELWNWRRGE